MSPLASARQVHHELPLACQRGRFARLLGRAETGSVGGTEVRANDGIGKTVVSRRRRVDDDMTGGDVAESPPSVTLAVSVYWPLVTLLQQAERSWTMPLLGWSFQELQLDDAAFGSEGCAFNVMLAARQALLLQPA